MSKIKICGLFRECDATYVNEAMPDFAGFVFAKSRRQVSADMAAQLRDKLHPSICCVGVFVNAPVEEVADCYKRGLIQMAQLHGTEDLLYLDALRKLCRVPIIKAVNMDVYEESGLVNADYYLLDHGTGGTGESFDWSRIPKLSRPHFLAGGICEENLMAALQTKPYAIDVSSGVETEGVKDKEKIKKLVQMVRTFV